MAEITEDQRAAIRETIAAGLAAGRNPRAVAFDLAGRLDRVTGKRIGGIIGLTSRQAEYVRAAREQLLTGDSEYFKRALRDKRFDRSVRRAFDAGRGLSASDADAITGRYSDRLLSHRAEVIARTESIAALHAGQVEGMQQVIDGGKVRADQVTKIWDATGDKRTRHTHLAMDGQSVGFGQPFVSPSGAMMMYPHDTSLGAPASEIVQCRCFMQIRVRYL